MYEHCEQQKSPAQLGEPQAYDMTISDRWQQAVLMMLSNNIFFFLRDFIFKKTLFENFNI